MRYPPHILDEIRARLPISAVAGRKVRLKRAGREWRGLSPFGPEKTPSFYANDAKGRFFDFSAGTDGDIFNFVMQTEGLTFPEAVERLAAEAGVSLPSREELAPAEVERRRGAADALELACRFYEARLAGRDGRDVRAYLDGRGIGPDLRAAFRIGHAPASSPAGGRTALLDHLAAAGVPIGAIREAGLLVDPEDGRPPIDRFAGRVTIPIMDSRGRVVGFGARALRPDQPPKYLNSPATPLFDKGRLLFNAHRARAAMRASATGLLVFEGYTDVIAAHAAGIGSAVATLGTALTPEQLGLLWRMSPEPILCFDGDRAGRSAAFRALDRILPELRTGFSVRFALLPAGLDPDELLRARGAAGLRPVLDEAAEILSVLFRREVEKVGRLRMATPDGQAVLEREVLQAIATIPDPTLRRRYDAAARAELRETFWDLNRRVGPAKTSFQGGLTVWGQVIIPPPQISGCLRREALILSLLVAHPDLLDGVDVENGATEWGGEAGRAVWAALAARVAGEDAPVPAEPLAALHARLLPFERRLLEPDADRGRVRDAFVQLMVLHERPARTAAIKAAIDELQEAGDAGWDEICAVVEREAALMSRTFRLQGDA